MLPSSIISSSSIPSVTSLIPSVTSVDLSSSQSISPTSIAQASSSSTELPMNNAETSNSTNKGAIVGGVVGGICGAAVLAGLFFFLFRRSRHKKSQIQKSGANDMFQYAPENGASNWGNATSAGAGVGGAVIGGRAFVPPGDSTSQPYTDDYPPTTPHNAIHDDGYYYSPTNGASYSQNDADYYNNTNVATSSYYNYADGSQMGSEPYNDQNYYNEGYNDAMAAGMAGVGATGMAAGAYGIHNAYNGDKVADADGKTFVYAGENSDPRHIYSKPDAKEE
jgi:hypothetical protein